MNENSSLPNPLKLGTTYICIKTIHLNPFLDHLGSMKNLIKIEAKQIMNPKRDAKNQMKTQVFQINSNLVQLTFASVPFIWTQFWIIWAQWKIRQNRSQAIMKLKRDAKNCLKTQVFQIHSNLVQLTFASVPFIWTQFWIIPAWWKICQKRSQTILKRRLT